MIIKTSISILLSAIVMALTPNVVMAVEKTGSSSAPIAAWPLVLFIVIVIILRKRIFAEATPEPEHHEEPDTQEPAKPAAAKQKPVKKEAVKQAPAKPQVTKKATPAKKTTPAKKPENKAKATSGPIDLTDDSKQCQASTTKGTRCKRTTTLENTTATVDGKTYQLTVCTQHNNDKLKIFSGLLK